MIFLRTGEKTNLTVSWLMHYIVPLMPFEFNNVKINGGTWSKDRLVTFKLFSCSLESNCSPKHLQASCLNSNTSIWPSKSLLKWA